MEDLKASRLWSAPRFCQLLTGGQEATLLNFSKPQFLYLWVGHEGSHIWSVLRKWKEYFSRWAQSLGQSWLSRAWGGGWGGSGGVLCVTVVQVSNSSGARVFIGFFDLLNEWPVLCVHLLDSQATFLYHSQWAVLPVSSWSSVLPTGPCSASTSSGAKDGWCVK